MDILELLPEINKIRDPELRNKTAQIWEEAMEAGTDHGHDLLLILLR